MLGLKINWDDLLDQVDVNRLLDRVDVNRLLDRVEPDRLLDRVDPDAVVLMEQELWPGFLSACHRRGIPVVLANARMSADDTRTV